VTTTGMNETTVLKGTALRIDSASKGCANAFPPGFTTLPIRNTIYTQADIQNKLAALAVPWQGVLAAHLSLRQFTQGQKQNVKVTDQFLGDLKSALGGAVGSDNQLLAQWGFKVKKPAKALTSEEKVLRAAKAKLTREKRGTLGSRQKAAIKQTVTPDVTVKADGTSVISTPTTGSVTTTS